MEEFHTHIYQREIAAIHYDKSFIRDFPRSLLENLVIRILKDYFPENEYLLKIFEGGVGTGLFSIPSIRYMLTLDTGGFFVGIDNSEAMLKLLSENLEFRELQQIGGERISVGYGDLEKPLNFRDASFNLVILGGVLQCLVNQHAFLGEIDRILEKDGFLMMVFKTDHYTKLLSGEKIYDFVGEIPYSDFWHYYYLLRNVYGLPVDARCRFIYDVEFMSKTIQIRFNNRYMFRNTYKLPWTSVTSFENMIFSIENGLTFATGQGISQEKRQKLSEEMKAWLHLSHLENTNVNIEHQMEIVVWRRME